MTEKIPQTAGQIVLICKHRSTALKVINMSDGPPEKIQALVADGKGGASVQSVPLPKLKEGEILVKVDYVALVSAQ